MKIQENHYQMLKQEIKKIPEGAITQYKKFVKNKPNIKDYDKAFRWGLYNSVSNCLVDKEGGKSGIELYLLLYTYLNDNHIDTALKRVVKELGY